MTGLAEAKVLDEGDKRQFAHSITIRPPAVVALGLAVPAMLFGHDARIACVTSRFGVNR